MTINNSNIIQGFDDKCVIIKIRSKTISARNNDIYAAVRWAWVAKLERAKCADYVLAVLTGSGGKVIGVFKPEIWYKATAINDKKYGHNLNQGGSEETEKRIAFQGGRADKNVERKYLHKFLPLKFRSSRIPVRYT